MLKKRAHKLWVIADLLQLIVHAPLQFFAFHQRFSGYARALGMTPNKLVRVEVWRVAGQEVQGKASGGLHQGQKCNSDSKAIRGARAEFHRRSILGSWIFRLNSWA